MKSPHSDMAARCMGKRYARRGQARALKNKIGPMLSYLGQLQRRMRYRGFSESDPLLQRVVEATNAVHKLHVETHYLMCDEITGRERRCEQYRVATTSRPSRKTPAAVGTSMPGFVKTACCGGYCNGLPTVGRILGDDPPSDAPNVLIVQAGQSEAR